MRSLLFAALLLVEAGRGTRRSIASLRLESKKSPEIEAYSGGALEDACRSIAVLHSVAPQDEEILWRRVQAGRALREGCRLESEGHPSEALGLFERALRLDPALSWAYRERAILSWRGGKREAAMASYGLYRRASERWPYLKRADCGCGPAQREAPLRENSERSERAFGEGVDFYRRGDWASAVSRLESAARLDPARPEVLLSLGVALDASGALRRALGAYDRAIETQDRYEELLRFQPRPAPWAGDPPVSSELLWAALSSRAETRFKLGLRGQALADLERIARQAPERWRHSVQRRAAAKKL